MTGTERRRRNQESHWPDIRSHDLIIPMPIPALNRDGLLPPGIHECSLDEIRHRFGGFQQRDRRPHLFTRLEELVTAMVGSGLFESVLVDGSFVTAKPAPNDVDLLAVLKPGHDFERDLPVSDYALVSRSILRRRSGFDVVVVERDSVVYETYIDFFGRVREAPDLRKGILRLRL